MLQVTVKDIDLPRLCIESCSLDKGIGPYALSVSAREGGADVALPVVLSTKPTAEVVLSITVFNSSQVQAGGGAMNFPRLPVGIEQYSTGRDFAVSAIDDQVAEGDHVTELCVLATSYDPFYDQLQRCALLNIKDSLLVKVKEIIGSDGGNLTGFTGIEVNIPPGALNPIGASEPVVLEQVDPDFQPCPMDPNKFDPVSLYSMTTESGEVPEFQEEVAIKLPLPDILSLEEDDDQPGAANYHVTFLDETTCEWKVVPVPKEGDAAVLTTSKLPSTWGLTQVKPQIRFVEPEEPKKVVFTEAEEPVILDLVPELEAVQELDMGSLTLQVISVTIDSSTFEPDEDILLAGDMDHEEYYRAYNRLTDAEVGANETRRDEGTGAEAEERGAEEDGSAGAVEGDVEEAGAARRRLKHDHGPRDWSKWEFEWDQTNGVLKMTSKDGPASYSESSELLKTVSYFNPKRGLQHELNRMVKLQLLEEYTATPRVRWVEVDVQPIPTPPVVLTTQFPVRCVERAGFVSIDDNVTLFDVDSTDLSTVYITIEPSVEGDIIEYNVTEGLAVSQTNPGQWQASGLRPLSVYQGFLRSLRIKNDGPTVRDSDGEFMRRVWFYVKDESETQGWGFRDVQMVPVNDPPVITAPMEIKIREEQTKYGFLQAYDPEGEAVTYATGCAPQKGTLTVNEKSGAYIYQPFPDEHGSDKFVFVASDPQGLTDVQTVEITIANLPDPPKAEDLTITVWMGLNNSITLPVYDPDGDEVRAYITREPEQAGHVLYLHDEFRTQPGSSRRGGNNPVIYNPPLRPVSGYLDSFEFAAVAVESRELSSIRTCTLVVQNPGAISNQPPLAENITVYVRSGESAIVELLAIDDVTSTEELQFSISKSAGSLGRIDHAPGPGRTNFSYSSYPGVNGIETMSYTATDVFGLTGSALLTFVVEEYNAAPVPACMQISTLFHKGLERIILGQAAGLLGFTSSDAGPSASEISELYSSLLSEELASLPFSDVRSAVLLGMDEVLSPAIGALGAGNGMRVLCDHTSVLSAGMATEWGASKESAYLFAYDVDELAPLVYNISSPPMYGSIHFETGQESELAHPNLIHYFPDPLRRGSLMDSFQWTATDKQGLTSAPATVHVQVACAPGYRMVSETACEPCPAGYFNLPDSFDQNQCYKCPSGSSAPLPASTSCTTCPANTYADRPGMPECLPCPDEAMMSLPGSNSSDACLCVTGHFVNLDPLDPDVCLPCPVGSTVCDEIHQPIPKPASVEWWVAPQDGTVVPCLPRRHSCLHHRTVPATFTGECQDGYVGYGCRVCDAGFYRSHNTHCRRCSRYTWLLYSLTILALILAVPMLTYVARLHIWGPASIIVAYIQTNAMLISMDFGWPNALKTLYAVIMALIVKFELFSPQCLFPKSPYLLKLIIINCLPLAMLLLFIPYIYYRRWRAAAVRESKPEWCGGPFAGFLALLSVAYTTIVDMNLEYWNCEHSHDGLYFMVASPNTQCWNFSEPNLHTRLRPLVIVAMMVYVAGVPLLFAALLFWHRKQLENRSQLEAMMLYGEGSSGSSYRDMWLKAQAGGDEALEALTNAKTHFGFLFRRYDPENFWWELVVLAKKLGIALAHHLMRPGSPEQGSVAFLIIMSYGLSVARFAPYDGDHLDAMDYVAEIMSMTLTVFGLVFFTDILPGTEENTIGAILAILTLVSFGVMAAFTAFDAFPKIRQRFRVWRIDRSIEKLQIKRDMQERRDRRKAKWKSVAKRASTGNLSQLVAAANEAQRIAEEHSAITTINDESSPRFSQIAATGKRKTDPAAAAAWAGAPIHERGLGGSNISLVGRLMRPIWMRKIKAELEREESELATAKQQQGGVEGDEMNSKRLPPRKRSTGDGAAWRRMKRTIAMGGISARRACIIKLFSGVLTRESLDLVKAWVSRSDLDDADLNTAEELGRQMFKLWGLTRALGMAVRRTHSSAARGIEQTYALNKDSDSSNLFVPGDNVSHKALEYLGFEACDFTRQLMVAVAKKARGEAGDEDWADDVQALGTADASQEAVPTSAGEPQPRQSSEVSETNSGSEATEQSASSEAGLPGNVNYEDWIATNN